MASIKKRLAAAIAAAGLSIGLGGCMGDYGYGGVGYASDYYDGYGGGYGYGPSLAYGGYGGGYGGYGGWYDNYYYPGAGVYVFDRSGRRSRWNDGQRRYWEGHRGGWNGQHGPRPGQYAGSGGQGRPGGGRPDRPGRGQGYDPRGGWRNGQAIPRTNAQANAILGRPSDYRPSGQSVSGGWRGQGAASAPRGGGFQGHMGGGGGRGGRGRGGGQR